MKKSILLLSIIFLILLRNVCFATYVSSYSEPSITLKRGTYGTGVKWLQDMLNHNGYSLSVDGEFGNETYITVMDFQKNKGLEVDGIVGKQTKQALKMYAETISSGIYKYTTTRVNFRSGPSTSYSSYQVLDVNTKVYEYGKYDSNWSCIKYDNRYGYINSHYLSNTQTTPLNSNGLSSLVKNTSSLLQIIKNCKAYYANNNFYYSIEDGLRTIPGDQSTSYSGKYYVDCSAFVTWVLYEYASANNNIAMKNYFSYQRNSVTFANIGASGGNNYLSVVSSYPVDLSLAKPGDILVSNRHVEFFNSYTSYSPTYAIIKVYNCGSNTSIKNPGITTSATLNPNDINYILRVK